MNGHGNRYRIRLAARSILVTTISVLVFAVILLPVATLFGFAALLALLGIPVTPVPGLATTVAVFLGTTFGAGLGLASRVPLDRTESEETDESRREYPGEYRLGPVAVSSRNVSRDLRSLLDVLRACTLVAVGFALVEFGPSGLGVSPTVLVMAYTFADEVLYSFDLDIGGLPLTSPSGYVYEGGARTLNSLHDRGVIRSEEFQGVNRARDGDQLGSTATLILRKILPT